MANGNTQTQRIDESYIDTGSEKSIKLTLPSGGAAAIVVPDDAKGFRILALTADCRFASGYVGATRTPVSEATGADTDGTVAASDFQIGNTARLNAVETRLLRPFTNVSRTVNLLGSQNDIVIFETF